MCAETEVLRARLDALGVLDEQPENPVVWGERPDIYWCMACDVWHRDDYEHDWNETERRQR